MAVRQIFAEGPNWRSFFFLVNLEGTKYKSICRNNNKYKYRICFSKFIIFLNSSHMVLAQNYDDKIMAIVNDRVILKSEIQVAIDYLAPEIIAKEYVGLNDQQIIKLTIQHWTIL